MKKTLFTDDKANEIRVSEFNRYEGETRFINLAVKFVVKGSETYYLQNRKYEVKQGEYIIGNGNTLAEVNISENTMGICLDVSNDLIQEILETIYDNPDLSEFVLTDKLLINKYRSQHSLIGHKMSGLSNHLIGATNENIFTSELFYSLGESIIVDQALIFEQFSKLNFKKRIVNEEVFRNLFLAKEHIDDCYLEELDLQEIAQIARMSKYAFLRSFKTTFGITPYQYLLQKRLMHAKQALLNGNTVFEVAITTGFSDTAAFSKSFKQCFGIAPSKILK